MRTLLLGAAIMVIGISAAPATPAGRPDVKTMVGSLTSDLIRSGGIASRQILAIDDRLRLTVAIIQAQSMNDRLQQADLGTEEAFTAAQDAWQAMWDLRHHLPVGFATHSALSVRLNDIRHCVDSLRWVVVPKK